MNIDILLDSTASDSEIAAVKAIVLEEGIEGSIEASWSSRGEGEFPWIICLTAPVATFLSAFFATIGKKAGEDAYQLIRRLVAKLFDARRNRNGAIELWDQDTRTHIILTDDLPCEAYAQLAQKGLDQIKGGYWTWDSELKEWQRI